MELCSIEARALKSSFLSRMALKMNSQVLLNDDGWSLTGINSVSGDDFHVEELLNLDFLQDKDFQSEGSFSQEEENSSVSRLSSQNRHSNSSSNFSGAGDFDNFLSRELSVPVDELENLEWLSQFVDDSTSGLSLLCPTGSLAEKTRELQDGRILSAGSISVVQKTGVPCFPAPIPGKARSKRSRQNGRAWSLTSSSVSTTSTSSSYGSSTDPVQDTYCFSSVENQLTKKQKRKPAAGTGSFSQTVRRCTHCHVQKTPQWRAGPFGPKTLCNACGVRYKSGRLLPEYRPACSPSFSRDIHSNSHRKVLEMRQKKEISGLVEPGLTPMVPSF
ncbi:GATA transcription factor 5 [Abeliophyllum distichum]|uniref:GATA transcription factor n=1 Tax=Abeliophyllum distichum TaxID=126358 RepID=A0ABD1THY8_9LAMI